LSSRKYSIKNQKLLIAGGAIEKFQVTRDTFSRLNDNIDINFLREYTSNKGVIFLVEQLKNNVKVIQPVTYFESNHVQGKGECNNTFVFIMYSNEGIQSVLKRHVKHK
jgi:hypothetical protein